MKSEVDDSFEDELILMRVGLDTPRPKWAFHNLEEEIMSQRQMIIMMNKVLMIPIEELAFMFLEFKENPGATKAYFGITGHFLYCQ